MSGTATAPMGNQPVLRMQQDALHIFEDVSSAQTALGSGNTTSAQRDLMQAMQVRDRLAMTARNHNLAKVVPIYSEMSQNTAFGTIMAAKNNGKPMAAAKVPVTVDDVQDQYTFVGVDLDKTKLRLHAAEAAIRNNNVQAAKDTLSAIGDDLVVTKVAADAPLLAVRENLGLAENATTGGHPHEATAALQQVSGELQAYSQMSGVQHGTDAQQLEMQVDHMLKTGGQKQTTSANRIGTWWGEVNGWMQVPTA